MNQIDSDRPDSRVGTTLKGKWRLDRLIGAGATATVYAATHRNGHRVAIKVLHAKFTTHPEVRQRFLSEGYVANRVGHRGIVTVHDDDTTEDGCPFLVLDLLHGQTMQSIIEEASKPLPLGTVLAVTDHVLETLGCAHSVGIVHRDVKPDNVFVTVTGDVKLLDFGIAREEKPRGPGRRRTLQGIALGTPAFMPPEQARGEWDRVDERTDVWSVGATMFFLLTQETVHHEESLDAILQLAGSRTARPLGVVSPETPASVQQLVDRALAFDPRDRFRDAEQMRRAVRAAMATAGTPCMVPRPRLTVHAVSEPVNVLARTVPRTAASVPPQHVSEPPRLFAPKRTIPPASPDTDWSATWTEPRNQSRLEMLTPRWEQVAKDLRSGARILVVDDDSSVRRVLSEALSSAGYSVDTAPSAVEAIDRVSGTRYDLMVIDEQMPDKSGLELMADVRTMTRELPLALITDTPSSRSIEDALGAGATDYITKPFRNLDHLVGRLSAILHRRILELVYDVIIGDLVELSWTHGEQTPDVDALLSQVGSELEARCDVAVVGGSAQAAIVAATLNASELSVAMYFDTASALDAIKGGNGALSTIIGLHVPGARFSIRDVRRADPLVEVLVTAEGDSTDAALQAVTAGASDFVLPGEGSVLLARRAQRLVDRSRNRRTVIAVISELYRIASRVDEGAARQVLAAVPPEERKLIGAPTPP